MHDRVARARRTLTEAPADLLVERLARELGRSYGITDVELLQVDYRLSSLLPLTGGEPVTAPGHPAWRCFDHQDPIEREGLGYFPVSTRGERIGVLRMAPVPADPQQVDELTEIATALAHELASVADGTDRYTVAARSRRLTLAAEMQWSLLPARCRIRPSFSLAGQLEPAYAVRGDSFDWSDDGHRLWLSIINGSGEGVEASALTALATYALRNARRAGVPLTDQAALADQAVYAHHRGDQHVSVLLLELDLTTGGVTAIDAGSPRLILQRDDALIDHPLEAQFPFGMFEGTEYTAEHFELRAGDRLFVLSDGVVDSVTDGGRYGETALDRVLRRTRSMAPLEAVRAVLSDLRAYVSGDLVDDAVVVCLDWSGPVPPDAAHR